MRVGLLAMTVILLGTVPCGDSPQALAAGKELSEGDRLYRAKCTSCHRLLKPKDYPDEKWQEAVKKFGKKLTDEERKKILEHLQGNN